MLEKNLKREKINVLKMLERTYGKISKEGIEVLNYGRIANATVFRYKDDMRDLTIKDFSESPFIIKNTVGRLFIKNEANKMMELKNNKSVAGGVNIISPYTLSFNYIEGTALKGIHGNIIGKEFFITLEKNIKKIQDKDIVHLDLRNLGNIIMGKDGYPYIIDFQSAIKIKFLPRFLRKILFDSDLSGVCKAWQKRCVEELDEGRKKFLENFNRIRKIWILKGYPIQKLIRKVRKRIS
ncbi:MAG: hypothetical protein Q7K48_07390 [Fusobacterium sp. JB021]|nr:hypothetical protein [Fusobacterium sp. JB021]MDP0506644.1 hypothetical protein [Fusobacterium sp. JB019]